MRGARLQIPGWTVMPYLCAICIAKLTGYGGTIFKLARAFSTRGLWMAPAPDYKLESGRPWRHSGP